MSAIFVSDVHLDDISLDVQRSFYDFLSGPCFDIPDLYILGDLMDAWVGDDVPSQASVTFSELARSRHQRGLSTYYMHGNRDFMIGRRFCKQAGLVLLSDPSLIRYGSTRLLLSHGDQYCTDDVKYQKFRRISRNPILKNLFLLLPKAYRNHLAIKARSKSKAHQSELSTLQLDVSDSAVIADAQAHQATILIHGHVHTTGVYQYEHFSRWVMSDWHATGGSYIHLEQDTLSLKQFVDRDTQRLIQSVPLSP